MWPDPAREAFDGLGGGEGRVPLSLSGGVIVVTRLGHMLQFGYISDKAC